MALEADLFPRRPLGEQRAHEFVVKRMARLETFVGAENRLGQQKG